MRLQRSPLCATSFAFTAAVTAAATARIQDPCSKLASNLAIDNATAHFAEYVTAGTNPTFLRPVL
jgi:hypothetical protein